MHLKLFAVLGLLAALATSGCASLYVNDPDLAKNADAADTAVQAADTLKPYATQLANLQSDQAQNDLALANLDVAERDVVTLRFIGQGQDPSGLDEEICDRLKALVGDTPPTVAPCKDAARIADLAKFNAGVAKYEPELLGDQARAASDRANYELNRPADDKTKDDCDTLTAEAPISRDTDSPLAGLQSDCKRLSATETTLSAIYAVLGSIDGQKVAPVVEAAQKVHADAAKPKTLTPDQITALQKEVDAAADLAKNGAAPDLAKFQADVEAILKDGSGAAVSSAAQVLGWQKVQTVLSADLKDVLTGTLCAAPAAAPAATPAKPTPAAASPPAAAPAAAAAATPAATAASSAPDCSAVQAASTSGRVAAVWTLLQAIAQTFDANDPRLRSASWLAAANAIVTAQKQNAQLEADGESRAANSTRLRLSAMTYEASRLAEAHQFLSGAAPCLGATARDCALARLVDAWNGGRIPADVLAGREVEILREVALQKRLAVQTEQQSLARAASASLKAYADGGVQPATIAALISDVALLAAK